MYNNELKHYGVLGMKWGVRRYQNKDGSLTPAGRKRYGSAPKGLRDRHTNKPDSSNRLRLTKSKAQKESERAKKYDMLNRGTLTDEELKQKIQRLKMEKELRELTESEITRGQTATEKILEFVGENVAKKAIAGATLYLMKSAISQQYDRVEFGNAVFNGGPKKK